MEAQYLAQRLEVSVPEGGDALRGSGQGGRAKKVEVVERALDALKDVRRNAFEEVIGEAVVSTEKPGSNRFIVPARWGHVLREVAAKGELRERRDQNAPGASPASESDTRSSEHRCQVARENRSC